MVNLVNIGLVLLASVFSIGLARQLAADLVWILFPIVVVLCSYLVQYLISPVINSIFFKQKIK